MFTCFLVNYVSAVQECSLCNLCCHCNLHGLFNINAEAKIPSTGAAVHSRIGARLQDPRSLVGGKFRASYLSCYYSVATNDDDSRRYFMWVETAIWRSYIHIEMNKNILNLIESNK